MTPDEEAAAERSLARRKRAITARPPRSAGRLWRRIGLIGVLAVVVVATQQGALRQFSDRLFGAPINWQNDYAMSNRLYDMIVARELTDVPRACLLLNIHGNDPPSATTMDVFERPTETCMGPSHGSVRVLPKLFEMRVNRLTGRVESDSGTPGVYRVVG